VAVASIRETHVEVQQSRWLRGRCGPEPHRSGRPTYRAQYGVKPPMERRLTRTDPFSTWPPRPSTARMPQRDQQHAVARPRSVDRRGARVLQDVDTHDIVRVDAREQSPQRNIRRPRDAVHHQQRLAIPERPNATDAQRRRTVGRPVHDDAGDPTSEQVLDPVDLRPTPVIRYDERANRARCRPARVIIVPSANGIFGRNGRSRRSGRSNAPSRCRRASGEDANESNTGPQH